jgi:Superinfection immunity protein
VDHKHLGTGLLAALVTLFAVMTPAIGLVGLLPLAIAVYLLPTIIAFKVRHHYAGWLALINIVFGATGLGWLGIFVWALTGPRKSALDAMGQPSALGLSKKGSSDPALQMSDNELRSGWKLPVVQAEIFSFGDEGPAVEADDALKVFFKNPVVGIWRTGAGSSHCVRYNALTQIRCVAKVGVETKLRVGRTLGRTALTGIGAAILTGRSNALGAAFLDYRFGGDEKDEVVAVLIVFSDYSSVVIQSESEEFEKFCALLPSHVLSEEEAAKTAEEIDRIRRMAEDGPRVLDEMHEQIAKTRESIVTFAEHAKSGTTFAERDEGRTALEQAEAQLIDELAVLNAVERLIRLAGGRALPGKRIA